MKKIRTFGIVSFLLFSLFPIFAQDSTDVLNYIKSVVNSDAIVLNNDLTVTIFDEDYLEYTVNKRILIKNKNGEKYCGARLTETEFVSIDYLICNIKDTSGNLIKELESDDIKESEITPGYVFYSGNLNKYFQLTHHTYPYIIELEYKMECESIFFIPDWYAYSDIPTNSSTFKIILEKPIEFKFYNEKTKVEPVIEKIENKTIYTWEFENIDKVTEEDYQSPDDASNKRIHIAANDFKIENYSGSNRSWSKFGSWYAGLANNKYELSQNIKNEILELTKNCNNDIEKIDTLYKFLQDRNRYVAIMLGVGGWQPHSAEEVYINHYGDCKDLSTLMVAMLQTVDIKAYPALARTRNEGQVIADFPSTQFNHCIVFVPLETDSLWLECTAKNNTYDEITTNIQDIKALVIKDGLGELIKTPLNKSNENFWDSKTNAVLSPKGNLDIDVLLNLTGYKKDSPKSSLLSSDKKEQKEYLTNYFSDYYSNLNIDDYDFDNSKYSKKFHINVSGQFQKFTSTRGKRVFINMNLFKRKTKYSIPEEDVEERISDIYYRNPYLDIDTINISYPDNFAIESLPKSIEIKTDFANYSSVYTTEQNTISHVRKFEIQKNKIPLKEYDDFKKFIKKVVKSDKSKVILKKM